MGRKALITDQSPQMNPAIHASPSTITPVLLVPLPSTAYQARYGHGRRPRHRSATISPGGGTCPTLFVIGGQQLSAECRLQPTGTVAALAYHTADTLITITSRPRHARLNPTPAYRTSPWSGSPGDRPVASQNGSDLRGRRSCGIDHKAPPTPIHPRICCRRVTGHRRSSARQRSGNLAAGRRPSAFTSQAFHGKP